MPKTFVVAMFCVLAACGPSAYALRPGDLPPMLERVAPDQRVATWNRAIAVLLDEGYVPQALNEAACYISAKQRDDATVAELAGTFAIVTISPDGVVRVEIGGAGVYDNASQLELDLQTIQQRLARNHDRARYLIVRQSARTLTYGPLNGAAPPSGPST